MIQAAFDSYLSGQLEITIDNPEGKFINENILPKLETYFEKIGEKNQLVKIRKLLGHHEMEV